MTIFFLKLCGLLVIGVLGFWWIGRGVWRARRAASEASMARQAFAHDPPAMERRLLDTARPTNTDWKEVILLPGEPLLARDVATGELYALAAVEISFKADNTPREATAVYVWRGGQWVSEGRVVFDLEPHETLKRYSGSLVPVQELAQP